MIYVCYYSTGAQCLGLYSVWLEIKKSQDTLSSAKSWFNPGRSSYMTEKSLDLKAKHQHK